MTTSTVPRVAAAGEFYTSVLGFALCPIPPGAKKPETDGWQAYPIDDPDRARRVWTQRPSYGMGVVHGHSGTCALDGDASVEHIALALGAVGVDYEALLSAPGPRIVGNPKRPPKPIYRVPAGMELRRHPLSWPHPQDPTRRQVVFEVRAGLVQDILPPSIHATTGKPYRWISCPRRWEDVPLLPADLAELWAAWDERKAAMEDACPWAPSRPERRSEPARPARPRQPGEASTIDLFNELIPIGRVLERNGYKPTRSGDRWIAPGSTTGDPGVVLLDGRVYSHHGSDPLADGHAHDALSVMAVLEHDGDLREAVRAARAELGLRVGRSTTR